MSDCDFSDSEFSDAGEENDPPEAFIDSSNKVKVREVVWVDARVCIDLKIIQ